MNNYKSTENVSILLMASQKMLKQKLDLTLAEDELTQAIVKISNDVFNQYNEMQLNVNELNNITLSNIKKFYTDYKPETAENKSIHVPASFNIVNEQMDENLIQAKLRDLETARKIMPVYTSDIPALTPVQSANVMQEPLHQPLAPLTTLSQITPIQFKLPHIENKPTYKTLIINSLNRDWTRNPNRNSIKCNIPLDLNNNVLYPDSLIFPKYVKNITPYVLMNITDGIKNHVYTFTSINASCDNKWDVWKPIQDIENIALNNKQWSIKFFDFTNAELDLENDNISIVEAFKEQNKYVLKVQLDMHSYNNNFKINDVVLIKMFSGKTFYKKIIDYVKADSKDKNINIMTIIDDKNELNIDDFVNSKILNTNNQISLILKYHSKN